MLQKRETEKILNEQKADFLQFDPAQYCARREQSLVDLESPLAQVVIGVRRSGKSTLCMQALAPFRHETAYVNFDDERFIDIATSDLNTILESLYVVYGDFKRLFVDEIQNAQGWHLWINRLLRQRIKIVITGSNAKLLSGELATHLTGRNEQIELYPFSFPEYCLRNGFSPSVSTTRSEAQCRRAFDDYLKCGGFPELVNLRKRHSYVENLVKSILHRDIEQRYSVRFPANFSRLANHLMNVAPAIADASKLAEFAGLKSHHTAANYVDYLKSAYLLAGIRRYSPKSALRLRGEKLYPIDVALMDSRSDAFAGPNLGWRLETIVALELLRRNRPAGNDVYYYRSPHGCEADFMVCKGNRALEIFQVCYDLSNPKTKAREIRGLLSAADATGCNSLFIVTDCEREDVTVDNRSVKIIPAYEWCLRQNIP